MWCSSDRKEKQAFMLQALIDFCNKEGYEMEICQLYTYLKIRKLIYQ